MSRGLLTKGGALRQERSIRGYLREAEGMEGEGGRGRWSSGEDAIKDFFI